MLLEINVKLTHNLVTKITLFEHWLIIRYEPGNFSLNFFNKYYSTVLSHYKSSFHDLSASFRLSFIKN